MVYVFKLTVNLTVFPSVIAVLLVAVNITHLLRFEPDETNLDGFLLVPHQLSLAAKIGRASCGKECRSRWSPYH